MSSIPTLLRPTLSLSLAFAALLVAFAPRLHAETIKHDFVAIDEGKANLFRVNESDPSQHWLVHVQHSTPRDMQLIGNGRLLISHDAGFSEYDLKTGKLEKDIAIFKGVTSARRIANGHTLITGVDLGGEKGVIVLEVDDTGAIQNKIIYPGNYVRLMRETAQGTFLLMNDTMIREGDRSGKLIHEWTVPGFRHAWKAVRLPNGHTFATAGYGAFCVELDETGAVIHKFGAKGETPPEVNTNFYATFQRLPNGDLVLANWQGHGPTHGASGKQLIEFDKSDKVVWTWSDASMISSLQGVMVLDGLDLSKLYDERNGLVEPLGK